MISLSPYLQLKQMPALVSPAREQMREERRREVGRRRRRKSLKSLPVRDRVNLAKGTHERSACDSASPTFLLFCSVTKAADPSSRLARACMHTECLGALPSHPNLKEEKEGM